MEKQERLAHNIITENRQETLNKRETSWQSLAESFEGDEDAIYNITNNQRGKSLLLSPKISITKKDLQDIKELRQLKSSIDSMEKQMKKSSGRKKFILKQSIIESRKMQYIIKDSFRCPIRLKKITYSRCPKNMPELNYLNEKKIPKAEGVSLLNLKIIQLILNNYQSLKKEAYGRLNDDIWYLLFDFDNNYNEALKDYPIYKKIAEMRINGYKCNEIQQELEKEFGISYSTSYISRIWCKKIPKLLLSVEEDKYLSYYYLNKEKGKYKRCNRCGQIKLAHNKYFSLNQDSGDGFYSICKECRNNRKGGN